MVRNQDIKVEFALFGDILQMYKRLLPAGTLDNDRYWEQVVSEISAMMKKYPGLLAKDLAMSVLRDLERRAREYEN